MTATPLEAGTAPHGGPAVHAERVYQFFKLYDASDGHPAADQLQHDYLDSGSQG